VDDTDRLNEVFRELCAMEAPLGERLAAFSAAVRAHALPFADAYDALVARITSGEAGASAPGAGERMPPFALPDGRGIVHSLDDLLRDGPVVVSFNRGHWCEYCAIELTAMRQALTEIAAAGAQVVSIMPEQAEFVARAAADNDHAFLVLSDENNGYALQLNLVIWLGERVRNLFIESGLQLDQYQGNAAWFVPIPATFVVGADGTIAARYVDPDFRRRMEIDDILAALKSLQN
jgi:peroxiredoxin